MNNKKLLAALVAVTMSATAAVSFTGCGGKHTHEFTDWTLTTPPTCTEAGVETGTCQADGATDTRPVDALGHNYGDWQVVAPTATAKGSATKVCANDASHPLTVELPVLGDSAYTVRQLKDTYTYTQKEYTLANDNGNIKFVVDEDKKGVTLDVAQAVETANDAKYIALVGKGEGTYHNKMYQDYFHRWVEESLDLLYEYGDNFTHIKDDAVNGMEYWGEKDASGNITGVIYKDGDYSWIDEVTQDYYNGMYFNAPAGILEDSYQYIEGLLGALYEAATAPGYYNNEFKESVDGSTYKFSWTILTQTNDFLMNADETDYEELNIHTTIKHIAVEFSLDANYMLNSFKLNSEQYLTDTYHYTEANKATKPLAFTYDETLDAFIPKADAANLPFDYDAATKTYAPKEDAESTTTNDITVTQTALKDIAKLPVNDFKHDKVAISSIKLMLDLGKGELREVTKAEWDAISDNDPAYVKKTERRYAGEAQTPYTAYFLYKKVESGVTLSGDTSYGVSLFLDSVTPESALEYLALNPARGYLIENGKETLIYSSDWKEQDKIPEEYTNWLTQRDYLQVSYGNDWNDEGEIISYFFTLRSEQKTGDFKVKLCFGEAEFNLTYHVDVAKPGSISTDINIYNEVTNEYRETTSSTATVYVGQPLTFGVNAGAPNGDTYLVDSRATATLADGTQNATLTATANGYSFVATEAGTYVINVKSLADETVTNTLTVTVEEAPSVEDMLTGSYDAGKYSVSFNENQVTVTDGADVNLTFGYTYANGELTATSNDGKYSVVLTENYKLALAYKDEFGDSKWAVFKTPEDPAIKALKTALAGTWSGSTSMGGTVSVVFNDETVMFSDGAGMVNLNYQITQTGEGTYSITVDDISGDDYYYNYWCMFGMSATGTTLEFNGTAISNFKVRIFDTESYAGQSVTVTWQAQE